ncbi:DUF3802 family protein [Parasalinivibrio latis]|uniref:DUF3802 family protein n=1 Tax=Parasalinivibrio latis TaxID=2952610 RepID=UPI0030E3BF0E
MVVDTEGYDSLIEYLTENLGVFEAPGEPIGSESIDDIVHDLVATDIMAICEQNPDLSIQIRFLILREADKIVADLNMILEGVWSRQPSAAQVMFLEDYIGLIKNLFDSELVELR